MIERLKLMNEEPKILKRHTFTESEIITYVRSVIKDGYETGSATETLEDLEICFKLVRDSNQEGLIPFLKNDANNLMKKRQRRLLSREALKNL